MRLVFIIMITLFAHILASQSQTWIAPVLADTIKIDINEGNESITLGKQLYTIHCITCHGKKGKGDGIGGISLVPRPADLSQNIFSRQTNGAIFWKIATGRPPMAAYDTILTKNEIKEIIHYLRTFSENH